MEVFCRSFLECENTPSFLKSIPYKEEININCSLIDYAKIGKFFNPKESKWTKRRLEHLKALYRSLLNSTSESLIKYYDDKKNSKIDFPNAEEDNFEPYFIYVLCKIKGMEIKEETTLEQMLNYLRWSSYSKEDLLKLMSASLNNKSLTFLASHISLRQEEKVRNFSNLTTSQKKQMIPFNDEEAIVLGALNYGINLTYEKDKIVAYITYHPLKSYIYLVDRYDPDIPLYAYGDKIEAVLKNEGFTQVEIEANGPTALSQLISVENNFYTVFKEDVLESKETPFYCHKIEECDYSSLLGYGIVKKKLSVLTVEELVDFFKNKLAFVNPFNKDEKLSERCINKLYSLHFKELKDVIDHIKRIDRQHNNIVKQVIRHKDKKKVITCLTNLLHLSFYMRGWEGKEEEIPLINTEVKDQNTVDFRVTEAINIFLDSVKEVNTVGNLPLMHYENNNYTTSNDKEKGLTIMQRINIVRNDNDNVNSCIRLSSNWLLSSAYYYLTLMNEKPDFDINKMRIIA